MASPAPTTTWKQCSGTWWKHSVELFVYQSALKDFLRLKRLVIWVIVSIGLGLIAVTWIRLNPALNRAEAYGQLSSTLVFHVLALISAIFASAVVGQEVEQRTIVYLLTRPISRGKLLVMRTLAAMTVVFGLSCIAAVCVAVGVFGLKGLTHALFLTDLKSLLLGAGAYTGMFVFVSLLLNRSMILTLLYAFGWETAVPNMPGDLDYLSIYSYMNVIADHPLTQTRGLMGALSGQLGDTGPAQATAYPVLIGFALFGLFVGAMWFSHFEYLPREDAE